MRGLYIPAQQRQWEAFFKDAGQRGAGGIVGFAGSRYQQGAGVGNIFSGLFRTLLPVAKSIGKTVSHQALNMGAQIAADTLAGHNLVESLEQRGREGAAALLNKGVWKMARRRTATAGK